MTTPTPPNAPNARRGRPRSEEARRSILDATVALLDEGGLADLTMEGIAERAGVGKATLYRWWPSRGHVALDALLEELDALAPPTGDTLQQVLQAQARSLVRLATQSPRGRALGAIVGEMQREPALAQAFRARFIDARRQPLRPLLESAQHRGELRPGVDAETIIDLVNGPIYLRILIGHAPLSEAFADEMVAHALRALRP